MRHGIPGQALLTIVAVAVAAVGCSRNNASTMAADTTGAAAPAATPAPAPESAATAPANTTAAGPSASTGAQTLEQNAFQPAPGAPSGITGNATVLKNPADTASWQLAVNLTGLPKGEHAWHIHAGPCSQPNAPVLLAISPTPGKKSVDGNLVANEQGVANDTVTIQNKELNPDQLHRDKLSLHVHAGAGADHGPTLVCAAM